MKRDLLLSPTRRNAVVRLVDSQPGKQQIYSPEQLAVAAMI